MKQKKKWIQKCEVDQNNLPIPTQIVSNEEFAPLDQTTEQLRKSVNLDEIRQVFAGDSQHKKLIFQNYVTFPAITAAYRQLTEKKTEKK